MNKICNSKVEVPNGIALNDKDYMTSLLTTLKDMEKNYTVSLTEASNSELYDKYLEMFNKISQMQRNTFQLMFKYGWYQLEEAEDKKIAEKYDCLKKEYDNLEL